MFYSLYGFQKNFHWENSHPSNSPLENFPSPRKIPTWNIPTHFINCLSSFNTLSINGGSLHVHLQNGLEFSHETSAIFSNIQQYLSNFRKSRQRFDISLNNLLKEFYMLNHGAKYNTNSSHYKNLHKSHSYRTYIVLCMCYVEVLLIKSVTAITAKDIIHLFVRTNFA